MQLLSLSVSLFFFCNYKPPQEMKLSAFNTLPPRKEYLLKVMRVLNHRGALSERELIESTGLTKTQLLCALEALIADGSVGKMADKKYLALVRSST
jgi:hypothetical protein